LPTLNGTGWLLVSLTANDQAIPPNGATPVTLEIDSDGTRISGSMGCNLYRATLSRHAAGIAIVGPALMTQKACAANLMVQEVEFVDSLLRTRSYIIRGNELTLLDAAGQALLVFVRE
jgi:heat shock protein HslJ